MTTDRRQGDERRDGYADIQAKLDRIIACLDGDDTDAKPGLRIRVDRLTQAKVRQDLMHGLWLAAAIGWLFDRFGGQ